MTCLLCGDPLPPQARFTDIICLTRPQLAACSNCLSSFETIAELHCPTCYKGGSAEVCRDCQYWDKQGYQVSHEALYHYNDAMAEYFSLYKFFGDYVLAQLFAKDLKKALTGYQGYTLVPVPVSPKTLSERGFNQVEGLLVAAGLPFSQLLTKGESAKQSSRSRQERLTAELAYELWPNTQLPKKIILVDDIYTTGATLASIVRLLRENGVEDVKTFSLAR